MNSANAFTYAISGSYTENQMNKYSDYVNQGAALFQQTGGWLAEQANRALDGFNTFLNSRAWEMSKRLLGKSDGDFVGRFDIGYLGSIDGLQGAQGYMRDYIMAHQGLMQDFLDERIEGYGGNVNPLCTGVADQNVFWRRAMNGLLNVQMVEDKPQLRHTHYSESLGGGLSFRERVDVQKTWAAIDHHRAKQMFDVTSESGKYYKDYVQPETTITEVGSF